MQLVSSCKWHLMRYPRFVHQNVNVPAVSHFPDICLEPTNLLFISNECDRTSSTTTIRLNLNRGERTEHSDLNAPVFASQSVGEATVSGNQPIARVTVKAESSRVSKLQLFQPLEATRQNESCSQHPVAQSP